ncbi:MAG: hypothetical protein H6625_00865 [Bdellovibrionaceae bacterium]|nr:hypothetical protein [Pseudobdellovibrionaceae bacterium]
MLTKKIHVLILAFLFSSLATAGGRDNQLTKELMKKNKDSTCTFEVSYLLQTKEGYSTTDEEPDGKVFVDEETPIPSSSLDSATYSLAWENEDYSFRYYMNSQGGEMSITSKHNGITASSDLDLSDMEKPEKKIGEVRLSLKEEVYVTHPLTGDDELGEKFTDLVAYCNKSN